MLTVALFKVRQQLTPTKKRGEKNRMLEQQQKITSQSDDADCEETELTQEIYYKPSENLIVLY